MTADVNIAGELDTVGLAVAQAAQRGAASATVILFGSRARGDHRANSDVDLLIVCDGSSITAEAGARQAIREYFTAHPPNRNVDIIAMSRERFNYCRRARNHVAGQAIQDGVVMNGEKMDDVSNNDDGYVADWPDVKERLIATYRNLRAFETLISELPDDNETYAFHAQQAVENAIKAWVSAAGLSYRLTHDLDEVAAIILNDPGQARSLAGHQLQILMDYITTEDPANPVRKINWLTRYAVEYRYGGTNHRMDGTERGRFHTEIVLAIQTMTNHVYTITGTGPSDLQ